MNKARWVNPVLIGLIFGAGPLLNCRRPSDPQVANGTLHETATIDVGEYTTLIVPEMVVVQEAHHARVVEIHLEKELAFHGHPPHPIRIEEARDYFGIARKEEDEAIVLATYGEWSSKEGGASIRIRVSTPPGMAVVKRPRLSGPDSQAKPSSDSAWTDLLDSAQFRRCYWYTATSAAPDWTCLQTTPVQTHQ